MQKTFMKRFGLLTELLQANVYQRIVGPSSELIVAHLGLDTARYGLLIGPIALRSSLHTKRHGCQDGHRTIHISLKVCREENSTL